MNLYLDDDSVDRLLIQLLKRAGHDVQTPSGGGIVGEEDSVHLAHAIQFSRVLLTGNHHDFANLHNLIMLAGGHHPRILVVRKDNDRRRDLSSHGITQAIFNFRTPDLG